MAHSSVQAFHGFSVAVLPLTIRETGSMGSCEFGVATGIAQFVLVPQQQKDNTDGRRKIEPDHPFQEV